MEKCWGSSLAQGLAEVSWAFLGQVCPICTGITPCLLQLFLALEADVRCFLGGGVI